MATEFDARIKFKRDTSSNWTSNNPKLLNGEIILVDTDSGELRAKVGDGVKSYTQLPFSDEVIRNLVTEHNVSETAHENMGWITSESGLPSEPALINADTLGGVAANEYATKEYVDKNKSFLIQMSIHGQSDEILNLNNSDVDNRITTQVYVDDNNRVWINNIKFWTPSVVTAMNIHIYLPEEYRSIFVPVSMLFIEKLKYGSSSGLVTFIFSDFYSNSAIQSDNSYTFYAQSIQPSSVLVIPNGYIGTLNA